MYFSTACISLVSFIAATGYAAPSIAPNQEPSCSGRTKEYTAPSVLANEVPFCPDLYLVEKWGYLVEATYYNASHGFPLRGCTSLKQKRDAATGDYTQIEIMQQKRDPPTTGDYTQIEVSEDSCFCSEYKDGSSSPQIAIWDQVDQICGSFHCDPTKSVSVLNNDDDGTRLVLSLDGQFATRAIRDDFIGAVKESFLRSALYTDVDFIPKRVLHLPRNINVQKIFHDNTGMAGVSNSIMMHMYNVSPKYACPDFLKALAAAGSAFTGPYAPFFGAITADCLAIAA